MLPLLQSDSGVWCRLGTGVGFGVGLGRGKVLSWPQRATRQRHLRRLPLNSGNFAYHARKPYQQTCLAREFAVGAEDKVKVDGGDHGLKCSQKLEEGTVSAITEAVSRFI